MEKEEALVKVRGYLTDYLPLDSADEIDEIIKALEQPSRNCSSCKHSDNGKCAYTEECHECMWDNKYEQQPCEDAISREYVESIVEELENICINGDEHILLLLSNIKNAPPVTPQQTEQEEAEEKQEEKKVESIEDKTWSNFNTILAIYSYYEKTLEDITKEPIPPCFNSICDPKYLKFALDGLEDAMAALTMLYKNILERSGTHGE